MTESKADSTTIDACRSCASKRLELVLDLGLTPLANSLVGEKQLSDPEPQFPLKLVFCADCSLLQITETVDPEVLFREYLYFSSFSDTMLEHAKQSAERLIKELALGPSSRVVEIASNDGYLLKHFVEHGIEVLGIEPALNIAKVAREQGVTTKADFFSAKLAKSLADESKQADLILANNVFAHVAELGDVVDGIRTLLAANGRAVIEVPYARTMIEKIEFDTIYHEHLCYYSVTALDRLFSRHELSLVSVEALSIHGGSLRLFVAHANDSKPDSSVARYLDEERQLGMDELSFYADFAKRVEDLKTALVSLLTKLKQDGKTLAAYGAAAKGSTLLNSCDLDPNLLDFVVDRSTYKQGRYFPGLRLPIHAPEKLLEAMPDHVVLLTWNFAEEILKQQAEYRNRGGRMIIPIPEVRIV